MKKLKKILQLFYSYRTIEVRDPKSGQKEKALYKMIFGIAYSITYHAI